MCTFTPRWVGQRHLCSVRDEELQPGMNRIMAFRRMMVLRRRQDVLIKCALSACDPVCCVQVAYALVLKCCSTQWRWVSYGLVQGIKIGAPVDHEPQITESSRLVWSVHTMIGIHNNLHALKGCASRSHCRPHFAPLKPRGHGRDRKPGVVAPAVVAEVPAGPGPAPHCAPCAARCAFAAPRRQWAVGAFSSVAGFCSRVWLCV